MLGGWKLVIIGAYKDRTGGPAWRGWRIQCSEKSKAISKRLHVRYGRRDYYEQQPIYLAKNYMMQRLG